MKQRGGYCDIQSGERSWCTELDLFEANKQSIQITVHTERGVGAEGGACNQCHDRTKLGPL